MFGRNGEAPVPIVAPAVARRLLRRRPRGDPDRGHLPHPGDAALRRLPGQRLRAVADPRGRRRCPTIDPAFATEPNHDGHRQGDGTDEHQEFWPYLRDEETLARPWAIPGTAGPRAPHRRPGEGRRPRQHLLRPGQPRPDGPHPAGQGRPDRRLAAAARGRRPRPGDGQGAGARLGLDVRPDRRRRAAGSARPATTSPRRTCATSTRSPRTSARSSSATTRCWCRR